MNDDTTFTEWLELYLTARDTRDKAKMDSDKWYDAADEMAEAAKEMDKIINKK